MNAQGTPKNPRGEIEWTHLLGPRTGYTANPVRGCTHKCTFKMPDGNRAICYAKTVHNLYRTPAQGEFEDIVFRPEVLTQIREHQQPAGIFIDSMSDLMCEPVTDDQIRLVLQCMADCPRHVFFLLTTNAPRLTRFQFPDNCLVGVSNSPSSMYGKELSPQQRAMFYKVALSCLSRTQCKHRWTSIEPLSTGVHETIKEHRALAKENAIKWAVIGAATNGSKGYQPDRLDLVHAVNALEGIPIFFKGNVNADFLASCAIPYYQSFPEITHRSLERVLI